MKSITDADILKSLAGRSLTIRLDWDKDWKGAVCNELLVSGFGATIEETLGALARSISSTIAAVADPSESIAYRESVASRVEKILANPVLDGTQTYRFQELLDRKGLSFASGNGMTLDELCDFIEKTTPDVPF